MREYCSTNFIFEGKDHYCIWFTEGMSGYITEGDKLKLFPSYEDLLQFARKHRMRLSNENESLAIDSALERLKTDDIMDCNYFISIWHAAEDIAYSLKLQYYGKLWPNSVDDVYDKMFMGCNLPAITSEGEEYYPIWTEAEMRIITRVIEDGINIIISSF